MGTSRTGHAASVLDMTPPAVLLPGQGSQVPGMRDAVAGARPDLPEAVLGPRCVPDAQVVALHDLMPAEPLERAA